jgi:hypothetical protein
MKLCPKKKKHFLKLKKRTLNGSYSDTCFTYRWDSQVREHSKMVKINLHNLELGNGYLEMTPKAQVTT